MSRVRVPIAFTKIDRWLLAALAMAALLTGTVLWLSQAMVSPPRPRVSASSRPTIGLALRDGGGVLRVVRAAGPAREAGMRSGDRIVAVDGHGGMTAESVSAAVSALADGQSLKIDARRGPAGDGETALLADVKVVVRDITPADDGLPYEDVSFRNADGLTLRGWYLPPPAEGNGRAPAIAYGHGFASDRRQWLSVALAVHEAGFAQLFFDFTGRGDSDGEVITLGAHESSDLRSALDALAARPEVDPLRLAVAGRSMGAVAALYLAADDARVKALVLDSPFADLAAVVDRRIRAHHIPAFLVRPILFKVAGWRAHYSPGSLRPVETIPKVKAPILLFHGDNDTVVPFDDARALHAASGGPCTVVPLPGLDHDDLRPASYQERIVQFLTSTLPSPGRTP